MGIECVWPESLLTSLPHGSGFKVKKLPKKIGVDFVFYGDPKQEKTRQGLKLHCKWKQVKGRKVRESKKEHIVPALEGTAQELNGSSPLQRSLQTPNHEKDPVEHVLQSNLHRDELDEHSFKHEDQIEEISQVLDLNLFEEEGLNDIFLQVGIPILSDNGCGQETSLQLQTTFCDSPQPLAYEQNLESIYLGLTPFSGSRSWIPGVELANNEPLFFHAFINGFIPSVSPQYSHPQLTPLAIFVPLGAHEPMMRDVFYACGAAFIAHKNPEVIAVARRRYAHCLTSFANRLSATGGKIEEWMVAAALLFTLRDKFSGSSPELPTSHLAKAVELIKVLRKTAGDTSISLKFFVDSFLFNYSVVLITGGRLARRILPSPFELFDNWRPIFESQPFQCFVPFMNNPVFGAAGPSFELAAKASWLVWLSPLEGQDMATACELLAQSYTLKLPSIGEPTKEMSSWNFLRLQQSVVVHHICKLAAQLLLIRLMHPTLELSHKIVIDRVEQILAFTKTLSADTTLWIICSWLLLITGLSAETNEHREFIIECCLRVEDLFRASFMASVCTFLQKSWGTAESPGPGWSQLFNGIALEEICL